ncbi:MAG TPA: hypothetical protein VFG23_16225 [Polyangia bacterium]|nr:hypothetical protein [Polyangia bacterium]
MRLARLSRRALASVLAALSVLGAGVAQARDAVAEGRAHLRKANALAGNDRCEAAIKEYSLAYDRLHDPVVLFNRAECYRRVGEDASAAADYRAFLSAVPGAPNRAEIEARIASIASVSASVDSSASSRTAPPAAHASAAATASVAAPHPTRPNLAPPSLAPPPVPSSSLQADVAPEPLVVAPAPAETPQAASPDAGHAGKLWIWAALGAAVAGGAVGAFLVLRTPAASAPSTELGNYRF